LKIEDIAPNFNRRIQIMLYIAAVILVVLWITGLATSYITGGMIHIFPLLAVVVILFELILGKDAVKSKN
jgi:F0F1-type ATP synthase assembly protein I